MWVYHDFHDSEVEKSRNIVKEIRLDNNWKIQIMRFGFFARCHSAIGQGLGRSQKLLLM